MLVALALLAGVARASPAPCESQRPIIFAGLNWESGEFITAVVQEILERGFGCRTETIPGNTMTFEQALANDDIQLIAEEWVDRSEIWRKAAAAGRVVAIGRAFTEATEGWAVPEYIVKGDASRGIAAMAPDLQSVAQLSDKKYVELFKDAEQPDRGRFLNCPSGWTCQPVNTAKIHAYGLDNFYVDFRPGTGPAMDAAIKSAYLQGRPALFYYWSPSAIAGALKIFPLREPAYSPKCWADMLRLDAPPTGGCASPPSVVVYGASRPFAVMAPQIVEMLSKATFRVAELDANLATMAEQKLEPREQAVAFLRASPETWTPWVDATVAARVQASLNAKDAVAENPKSTSFPAALVLSIREPVNAALAAVVVHYGAAFRHISHALLVLILSFDTVVSWVPWWLLIGILMLLAWLGTRRWLLTGMVGALMFVVGVLGLWDLMLQTLTLMLISSLVAVVLGLPIGIAAAKSGWFRTASFSVLDVMQTMPSFVYLIPALMLFGLGKVPALIATVIYALPPMIRLTALGIEQVPADIKEAATAFGVTPLQMLAGVELPLARPSIMAGINQTIMLSLSMVVIASMIGARGLGEQVLNGIQTLDIGKGLEAGIGIVILAVVLDRVTQGFGGTRFDSKSEAGGKRG